MSWWQTILNKIRPASMPNQMRTLVGKDHLGNKYFLIQEKGEDRRIVEYAGNQYENGISNLPTLWRSWILKSRQKPPTFQEVLQEEERLRKFQERVKYIDEKNKITRKPTEGVTQDLQPFLKQLTGHDIGFSSPPQSFTSAFAKKSNSPSNLEITSSKNPVSSQNPPNIISIDQLKNENEALFRDIHKNL